MRPKYRIMLKKYGKEHFIIDNESCFTLSYRIVLRLTVAAKSRFQVLVLVFLVLNLKY
jgi:hypothetical protein